MASTILDELNARGVPVSKLMSLGFKGASVMTNTKVIQLSYIKLQWWQTYAVLHTNSLSHNPKLQKSFQSFENIRKPWPSISTTLREVLRGLIRFSKFKKYLKILFSHAKNFTQYNGCHIIMFYKLGTGQETVCWRTSHRPHRMWQRTPKLMVSRNPEVYGNYISDDGCDGPNYATFTIFPNGKHRGRVV